MPRLRRVQLCDPVAERERVLTLTRNRHRAKKATETVDEKMKRLEHDKLYQQRKRSRETDEQRKKRLATERTRHKKRKEMQNYRLHLSEEDSDENESNSSVPAGSLGDGGTTLISGMSNPSPAAQVDMESESHEQVEIREAESTTPSTQSDPDPATAEPSTDQPSPVPELPNEPVKPKITINLKTPKEKQTIQIDEDAAIRDIKAIAAEKFSADPDYLCLIFAGKMMEDDDTLVTHSINEGMTIHLIIKTAPRQPEPGPQRPPADISQTPFGFGNIGGLAGLESLGMGSTNFKELQNRLQTELLGNPELLRRVLDNPLVQTLMNDSDNMKSLIQNNPQMQDLMNRHPEIRTMLNNSELLKHTAELAKNPSMLQELMRNLDGTNPMDGSTTTFTTLPSLYNAFQEPGLSTGRLRMQEAQKKSDQGGIFNNPQMSSLLQQMSENPQLVQNMLSAPYTQTMLQALSADPTMASAIINENPLYRNNPALQQYLTSMMPQLVQQLQNPEVQNMMANPQAVNALLQIQEGLDQLKNVAPGLVTNLGLGSFNDFTGGNGSGSSGSSSSDTPSSAQTTPTSGDNFSKFMSQMVSQMGQSDPRLPPEQRFKVQMEHLKAMGFTNEATNLQTLTACFGDLNATIQRLLAAQNNSKVV